MSIPDHPELPSPTGLRVAVLYNLKENALAADGRALDGRDSEALMELDSLKNVRDYCAALEALGHTVFAFEGNADLPVHLRANGIQFCFNTCEGFRGDSREAQVPALLEMLGIPYSGSKVLALAVTLDKAMTKRVLAYHHLPTPLFQEFHSAADPLDPRLRFPLFVKPNREGTGVGIHTDARVWDEASLRAKVADLLTRYRQSVLVEEYVEGRDVTCGLIGNGDLFHIFPISEVDHSGYTTDTTPFYTFEKKVVLADDYHHFCPAPLPPAITAEVRRLTVETFRACGCLDFARVDFRLDTQRNLQPMILEINALPGVTATSDLTLCAEAEGWTHAQMLQAVFNTALARWQGE